MKSKCNLARSHNRQCPTWNIDVKDKESIISNIVCSRDFLSNAIVIPFVITVLFSAFLALSTQRSPTNVSKKIVLSPKAYTQREEIQSKIRVLGEKTEKENKLFSAQMKDVCQQRYHKDKLQMFMLQKVSERSQQATETIEKRGKCYQEIHYLSHPSWLMLNLVPFPLLKPNGWGWRSVKNAKLQICFLIINKQEWMNMEKARKWINNGSINNIVVLNAGRCKLQQVEPWWISFLVFCKHLDHVRVTKKCSCCEWASWCMYL